MDNQLPLPLLRAAGRFAGQAAVALFALAAVHHAVGQTAAPALAEPLAGEVRKLILDKAAGPGATRIDVVLGQFDPRLRLAPCQRIEPYIPTGSRLWGPTRVGLRCVEGTTPWNVYLPVTVQVHGAGVIAATPLPAGHVLTAADLRTAEVDLSESRGTAVTDSQAVVGRVLSQPLTAGQTLRDNAMKSRQWFAPGDVVQVRASGGGFAISGSGEALSAGMEGQAARIRTEGGKVISGMPVGNRLVEITL